MIAVLQGTPGSGKTTALTRLVRTQPDISFVPELLLPSSDVTDDYFFANDLAKARLATEQSGVTLMDRDFTSTLAFVMARDGADSANVHRLRMAIDQALVDKTLLIPDVFFFFHLPPQLSLQRQQTTNASVWSDAAFVEKVDNLLARVVKEYIPSGIIYHVDGTLPEETVARQILTRVRRSEHEITRTS